MTPLADGNTGNEYKTAKWKRNKKILATPVTILKATTMRVAHRENEKF
jgi:hypothetical protein